MSRRGWTAFAVVQLVGAVCVWSGPRILTASGPVLFLSGLVLLWKLGKLGDMSNEDGRVKSDSEDF